MNTEDKKMNFYDLLKKMKEKHVQFRLILTCFFFFFVIIIVLSPNLLTFFKNCLPLKINFLILSPLDFFLNYIKIGCLFSLIFSAPLILYQFAKYKLDFSDEEYQKTALFYSVILGSIIICAMFFVIKILLPFEIMLLFGFNFLRIENSSGINEMIALFFADFILIISVFSIPLMQKLTLDLPVFVYKDIEKYKNEILIALGIFSTIIVLPVEILSLGFVFLMLCFFYRLLYKYAMRNKDEF